MSSSFGNFFKITTFGESHGKAIGVVIDGLPAGIPVNLEYIQKNLDRRKPSSNVASTTRMEADQFEILSGTFEGKTLGSPLCAVVYNNQHQSKDYDALKTVYRPGHADEVFEKKFGFRDHRGGGRSSGRETVARVIAGSIAQFALEQKGIFIDVCLTQLGNISAESISYSFSQENPYLFSDPSKISAIEKLLSDLKKMGDSTGAVIQTQVRGCPIGFGNPVFSKLDAKLSQAMLSIGAIKAIEFGDGFSLASMKGSESNDQAGDDTNHAGGISGGISNGKNIIFRCAVKPCSSISTNQTALTSSGEHVSLNLDGRFDVCIGPRAAIVIESMTAICLFDAFLENKLSRWDQI